MRRRLTIALGLAAGLALIVASCLAVDQGDGPLSGRMLIWHTWSGPQAEALNAVLASFTELNPDVTVRARGFDSPDEMQQQYLVSAASGLGPDVILAPSSWLRALANAGALAPIEEQVDTAVLERTMPAALAAMRLDDTLYGLPLTLDVAALYYNRSRVETPPATLDDLLAQAAEGRTALIATNFYDAFWGIPAFGGQLFDESGRTILDRGGFANWLAWLKDAREVPSMILDNNRGALRARFTAGEAAYYVGYARELSAIQEALGADAVGVAPLPSGPVGNAGPFLSVEGFYFSPVSSQNQRQLALALTRFITNAEQSGYLMRAIQLVPANTRVRANPRLHPIVANFSIQARSSVPLPDRPDMDTVIALGADGYNRVLEGDMPSAEVAFETANAINQATGFPVAEAPATACTGLGTIRLAHVWEGRRATALETLVERYRGICPMVIVDTESLDPDSVQPRLAGERMAGLRPTFVLGRQTWLGSLLQEGLIKNITADMDSATLQKFSPLGLDALRVQGNLYGLPVALGADALYFNRALVATPAAILDELRGQAGQGIPITLDTNFATAFWGIGAFGGQVFDADYRVIFDQGGMAAWLAWLAESREAYGIHLTTDSAALRAQFLAGETAYYIAGPDELEPLRQALGPDALGVALLPAGPAGSGTPLVSAEGILFRESAAPVTTALAQDFARYVTSAESQALLLQTADLLPANATVDLGDDPALATFGEQLRAGFLPPNHPNWETVLRLGDQAYRVVMEEGTDPAQAVAEISLRINEANGIAPLPAPAATISTTVPITPAQPGTAPPMTVTATVTETAVGMPAVTATGTPTATQPAATPSAP